jgi:hypothetical protein
MDGRTDGQTDTLNPVYPPNFVAGGIIINRKFKALLMNIEFISLVRQDFYHIFMKILKILSHS